MKRHRFNASLGLIALAVMVVAGLMFMTTPPGNPAQKQSASIQPDFDTTVNTTQFAAMPAEVEISPPITVKAEKVLFTGEQNKAIPVKYGNASIKQRKRPPKKYCGITDSY
jgi:hypothetical protein